MATYHRLARLGFRPLLLSWGYGSFHLRVFFRHPQPGKDLRAFALWLAADAAAFGLAAPPEAFPKQDELKAGEFGNWLRLPGRHHTRDTWATVFNGAGWVQGAAAVELAPSNIRVNAIAPGIIATPMTADRLGDPAQRGWLENRVPAGEHGEVSDIAGAAAYLISDAARYVNGVLLPVDGAWSAC